MGILGRRSGVAVALAAGLMTVLSACSDPAQPATLPTKSATATTAAPTTSTPAPPTAEEEVEQFIRDYYAELTRAGRTHDVSKLKTFSTKGCPCYKYVRNLRAAEEAGYTTPKIEWRIVELVVREINEVDAVVGVVHQLGPYEVLNRNGRVVKRFGPRTSNLDYSLIKGPNGWFIGNTVDLEELG